MHMPKHIVEHTGLLAKLHPAVDKQDASGHMQVLPELPMHKE